MMYRYFKGEGSEAAEIAAYADKMNNEQGEYSRQIATKYGAAMVMMHKGGPALAYPETRPLQMGNWLKLVYRTKNGFCLYRPHDRRNELAAELMDEFLRPAFQFDEGNYIALACGMDVYALDAEYHEYESRDLGKVLRAQKVEAAKSVGRYHGDKVYVKVPVGRVVKWVGDREVVEIPQEGISTQPAWMREIFEAEYRGLFDD